MRAFPGRRAALLAASVAGPLAALAVAFLPRGWAAAAAAALAGIAALVVGAVFDARLGAHAKVVRRWAAGDENARPPGGDALTQALGELHEGLLVAVGAWTRDEAQLAAILGQMAEGVVAVDAAGRVILVNAALSELLGVDAEGARGRSYLESLRHHGLVSLLGAVLEQKERLSRELRLFAPDELVFDAYAAPLLDAGQPAGALVVLHDITRLRRLEQVRRDFVANVSHELRTPLASIRGYAETLREGAVDDKSNRMEFLKTIEEQAQGLTKLVDDLLDLSAIESGHRAPRLLPVELPPLAREVARHFGPLSSGRGVALAVSLPDDLPRVAADKDQLRQVLANLVDNAVKYTESGGSVEVSARVEGGEVVLTVRDTGSGIPEADLPRVFERFYRVDKARTRDAGGTGLGLAIVKHLAEAQGGRVWVESRQPGGSTFSVALRAA
ncbi:MAG: ATP-binding protein [Elusimicrobiota bacterium]|nr:ATP-binding protein [Elusimicrobiota bacterium]